MALAEASFQHALAYARETGCDLATAALRVFGNADGAYGSNVNNLVENGGWEDEDELATTYSQRKGFAYGVEGHPVRHQALMQSVLSTVALTYQNVDSVELGVTSIDTYFDTLGGISRAVLQAKHQQDGNAAVAPIFSAWMKPFADKGVTTVTLSNSRAARFSTSRCPKVTGSKVPG